MVMVARMDHVNVYAEDYNLPRVNEMCFAYLKLSVVRNTVCISMY